jgi:hypothetical protein
MALPLKFSGGNKIFDMRLIKLALISFVVFFGIITTMSLAIPSHIRISKAINVAGSSQTIFPYIIDRSAWPHWHPYFKSDSIEQALQQNHIKITTLAVTDTLITVQWRQGDRRPVVNGWELHQFEGADSTTLQWYMDFDLPWYPWHKFGSLFYEKTYGVMMEQGLANLKEVVHHQNVSKSF